MDAFLNERAEHHIRIDGQRYANHDEDAASFGKKNDINMFERIYYNLEKKEKGEWADLLGSYDKADIEAYMEECKAEEPGTYRIREVKEEYAMLLTKIYVARMSELPTDEEVVILSPGTFMDYTSKLVGYCAQCLTVGANGDIGDRNIAFILTLEEDPMADEKERKWDFLNLCATEDDADALIASLKEEEEECWADTDDETYDGETAKRCLNRRYYKREIKVLH